MIFEAETWQRLIVGGFPLIVSFYLFFWTEKRRWSIFFLFMGSFTLRLAMISLDPFLHNWDERFHALVSKNMIENPFVPMLRTNPILPYDYKDWCCNHIWVHKQPLFLWQAALSMKLFGINEMAFRLPSALMGALSTYFTFSIIKFWTKNSTIAYIAGFMFSFSFFQLEMTSGRIGLEHNDIAFAFYVTASFWAFCRYLNNKKWNNAILIGLFVGAAILNKWLTGLLVFGVWALFLLFTPSERQKQKNYIHLILSIIAAIIVFLPWQIYISYSFPIESAWEYEFNRKHIFEALDGHSGSIFYHIKQIQYLYGKWLIPIFIAIGTYYTYKKHKTILSLSFIASIIVIYTFFSVVATKMPAFTFAVSSLIYGILSIGIYYFSITIASYFKIEKLQKIFLTLLILFITSFTFHPKDIAGYRNIKNEERDKKLNNTKIFKNIEKDISEQYVILNCKSFEDTELMFYQNCNAYHWYPPEEEFKQLLKKGYKIAVFKNHNNQILPPYISTHPDILFLDFELK